MDRIEVAPAELAPQALRSVVESFVLREGTDYGEREFSLDEKVAQVMRQLERGEARIMFEPRTQSVSIVVVAARRGAPRWCPRPRRRQRGARALVAVFVFERDFQFRPKCFDFAVV